MLIVFKMRKFINVSKNGVNIKNIYIEQQQQKSIHKA